MFQLLRTLFALGFLAKFFLGRQVASLSTLVVWRFHRSCSGQDDCDIYYACALCTGVYRGWMTPEARRKFGAPMFKPEVLRKQMCCIEESTCDIVGIFGAPRSDLAPHSDSDLGKFWLHIGSATYVVGNTSSTKANFRETLTALDPSLTIRVNKIWHRLDHRFGSP